MHQQRSAIKRPVVYEFLSHLCVQQAVACRSEMLQVDITLFYICHYLPIVAHVMLFITWFDEAKVEQVYVIGESLQ